MAKVVAIPVKPEPGTLSSSEGDARLERREALAAEAAKLRMPRRASGNAFCPSPPLSGRAWHRKTLPNRRGFGFFYRFALQIGRSSASTSIS
jgi:hypothetical protein